MTPLCEGIDKTLRQVTSDAKVPAPFSHRYSFFLNLAYFFFSPKIILFLFWRPASQTPFACRGLRCVSSSRATWPEQVKLDLIAYFIHLWFRHDGELQIGLLSRGFETPFWLHAVYQMPFS